MNSIAHDLENKQDTGEGNDEDQETKYVCPECSRVFYRPHNLKSHLLTHSVNKPFECPTCSSRFRRLHDLKRHIKLHTGEKPFKCENCGRKFARADALVRHEKSPTGCNNLITVSLSSSPLCFSDKLKSNNSNDNLDVNLENNLQENNLKEKNLQTDMEEKSENINKNNEKISQSNKLKNGIKQLETKYQSNIQSNYFDHPSEISNSTELMKTKIESSSLNTQLQNNNNNSEMNYGKLLVYMQSLECRVAFLEDKVRRLESKFTI